MSTARAGAGARAPAAKKTAGGETVHSGYQQLFWDSSTGEPLRSLAVLKDVDWATTNCPLAWEVRTPFLDVLAIRVFVSPACCFDLHCTYLVPCLHDRVVVHRPPVIMRFRVMCGLNERESPGGVQVQGAWPNNGKGLGEGNRSAGTVTALDKALVATRVSAAELRAYCDRFLEVRGTVRSIGGDMLAAVDEYGRLRVSRFPWTSDAQPVHDCRGHSSSLSKVVFTAGDAHIVTAGARDRCGGGFSLLCICNCI